MVPVTAEGRVIPALDETSTVVGPDDSFSTPDVEDDSAVAEADASDDESMESVESVESEESVEDQLARWDGRPLWIVDPLDGTTNFLHEHPHYCSSVGVAVDGRVVAGAVTHGTTGERW